MSLEANELDNVIIDETDTHFILTPRYTTMPAPGFDPNATYTPGSPESILAWRATLAFLDHAVTPSYPAPVPPEDTDPTNDNYYSLQWHFDYLGDIQKIWEEYNGAGVHVGVYDDGLERTHPDLQANYDPSRQVTITGPDGPVVLDALGPAYEVIYGLGHPHGTAVAGLIAAANNDQGVVGVAWGASLTGVPIFTGLADINANYAGFLEAVSQSANFDVVNHSWGKFPGFWQDGISQAQDHNLIDLWFDALEHGRGGLGTIQVKAAGNADQNSNGDLSGTTRVTIVVGAYDDDGDASYYSSYGSNLLVSAPSSGFSSFLYGTVNKGQVTTDLTGIYDNGTGPIPFGYGGLPDDDYTNGFGGTSGATPIVTGVIALMLEANPDLGWRDVQNIIAYSAHQVGSGVGGTRTFDENNTWKYNGADNWNGGGLHYSEDYGYGGIDAYNAVRMAEVWNLFGGPKATANESSFKQSTTQSVELADGMTTDIKFVFGGADFTVDYVNITIDLHHTNLDDLEIYLISPDGTTSTLIDFRYELSYYAGLQDAVLDFGANGFRGENGAGEWTIRIVDRWAADSGVLNSASIELHGTDTADGTHNTIDDVYHYTNEVFAALAKEPDRLVLNDTDGGTDWLDMSAMKSDVQLSLTGGSYGLADGVRFLRIAAGTQIENAVAGDGNDRIDGNLGANKIYGMRGNDILFGNDGDDLMSGGAGNDTLMGGNGSDIFLFDRALNAATNVDIVQDFNSRETVGTDKIWLDISIFSALSLGALSADAFSLGTAATDALDRIIYNSTTGALYYDADGLGGVDAIKFAQFDNFFALDSAHAVLSYSDFVIVDTSNSVIVGTGIDRVQDDAPTTSTSTATENLLGPDAPIYGTRYDDEIFGKSGDETIYGLEGNDVIDGGAGNDTIDGGSGIDQIFGGEGNDVLRGGGSGNQFMGDILYGGDGDDIIYGSDDQANNVSLYAFLGYNGDSISGGNGNDTIYGGNGDDMIDADGGGSDTDGGNDIIYGGAGSDVIFAGAGDDHIWGGTGFNEIVGDIGAGTGFDTVHFEGKFSEYTVSGFPTQAYYLLYTEDALTFTRDPIPGQDYEITVIDTQTIEALQFEDRYIDLTQTPIYLKVGGNGFDGVTPEDFAPINITTNGFEVATRVEFASDVNITDNGGENGATDMMGYVSLRYVSGDVVINSDRLNTLVMTGWVSDQDAASWVGGHLPPDGSVTVNAAAGERELRVFFNGFQLDDGERLTDNTATSIWLQNAGQYVDTWLNGAGVNDYNLSFASAESFRFYQVTNTHIQWYVPELTTIDIRQAYVTSPQYPDNPFPIAANGGVIAIDTAIDDSLLATAGSTGDFRLYADTTTTIIRLGNLGAVNASNDGTEGEDALMNEGLGFRGRIELGLSNDEVRILGSEAFQSYVNQAGETVWGFIDAGEMEGGYIDHDAIRMTFGVAEAIGDISEYIANFEVLELDVNSRSHGTIDVRNFDSVTEVTVRGTAGAAGENSVALLDNSLVTFKAQNHGIHFGTVNLLGSASALELRFTAPWLQMDAVPGMLSQQPYSVPAGQADGIVHVADAMTVNITTDSRDDFHYETTPYGSVGLVNDPPVDSFKQVLKLDAATSVTVSGDTGWDFTVAGTEIANVTSIDASGVTRSGSIGAVIATAQSAAGVTFVGGAGDDVFTGGAGTDTLSGGKGNDTFEIGSWSVGDIIDGGEGTADTVRSGTVSLDLNNYTNVENATLIGSANLDLTGNAGNNFLRGNSGNNSIDGGLGADTVVFSGNFADYSIVDNGDGSITVSGADGTDTLTNIEFYQFDDGRRSIDPTAPTDLHLSNNSIREDYHQARIGVLTADDAAGEDFASFSIVGDAAGAFQIIGNELWSNKQWLFDYEQHRTMDVTVRVTDLDGLTFDKVFTINIEDWVSEIAEGGSDDDVIWGGIGQDRLYGGAGNDTLRGGNGTDLFYGGTGIDTVEFTGSFADYTFDLSLEYGPYLQIRVTDKRSGPDASGADGIDFIWYDPNSKSGAADGANSEFMKFLGDGTIVNISDLFAPRDILLSASSVEENSVAGTEVATLTTQDGSTGDTFTYELIDDAGGRFALNGDRIVVAGALDYETATSHNIKVKVTDSQGHTFEKTLTIGVEDDPNENSAPTVVLENLLPNLKENASTAQPIKIADIVVTDDGIGTNRLSVTGRDAAMFQIIGMALFLKAGVLLDAATAAELEFAVAVDDDDLAGSPDAVSNTYALNIEDVAGYGVIRGTAAGERINGTSGDDVIIGNGGDDDMRGGKGNDTYIVDSIGDKVTEASGGGLDTVMSSVSYKLGNHVENLTLTGGGDIDGTGNSKNNVITGNDGSNVLKGGDGNDTIYGGGGTDTIYGDAGNDKLYGGSGADKLYGGSGDDILDGGANADQMWGSSGNDVYYVDDEGDVVTESSSQGTDTIYASVNYTLGSSQERLYLTGTDEVSATGNTKDNRIGGNEAANLLTGGAGKDAFVFNTALGNGNVDTIADFNVKDDTIWLDNAFFVGVGKDGNLSSGAFFAGTAAHDASDRIIYDKDTGALYFDADGSGAGEQIQFAELDANLALTYKDFYVI